MAKDNSKDKHAEVYVLRDDNPRQRQRTMPMEVLSLGYSRTGTMTIQAALEILGIPTWHNITMAQNLRDMAMWAEGLEAKFNHSPQTFGRREFDQLLGHWGACTDQPAIIFAEELVVAYPDAKVILVERDEDNWFRSYCDAVIANSRSWTIPYVAWLSPNGMVGQYTRHTDLMARGLFGVTCERGTRSFGGNEAFFDQWQAGARKRYREHYALVKRVTPPERLLKFDLKEGWQPLCEFLRKPIPDVPFPRVNETKAIQEKVQLMIAESFRRSLVDFTKKAIPVVVLSVAALWWWLQR